MKHEVAKANWHIDLADKIETAEDGDTIVCHAEAMVEMGKSALSRMCPEKKITFEIENA